MSGETLALLFLTAHGVLLCAVGAFAGPAAAAAVLVCGLAAAHLIGPRLPRGTAEHHVQRVS